MDHPLVIIALCALCIGAGIARIGAWIIDRREQQQTQLIHEQVYAACAIAQARADLASTGWTAHHESLYQAEIEASRRGDFIAAARFAEQQEAARA